MAIEVGSTRTIDNNTRQVDVKRTSNFCPPPNCGCVAEQVRRIDQAQKEAILEESCLTCSSPRLGDNVLDRDLFNTRPFSLYLPNGEKLAIDIVDPTIPPTNITTNNPGNNNLVFGANLPQSSIFRVERVDGCCALLRALAPRRCDGDASRSRPQRGLVATCFCCTCDLTAFVCIQCYADTFVPGLENCFVD